MPHPQRMICWTLCAWFCFASARPAFGVDDFAFFHENVMGTSLELESWPTTGNRHDGPKIGFSERSIAWP